VVRDFVEEGHFDKADLVIAPATTVPEYVFENKAIIKDASIPTPVSSTVLNSRAESLNNVVTGKVSTSTPVLTEVSYTGWIRDDSAAGQHRVTYGIYGFPTVQTDLPTTGTVTYTARVAGRGVGVGAGGTGSIVKLGGTVTVTVNFAAGSVNYTANLTQIVGGVETAYGTYTGSASYAVGSTQFTGNLSAAGPITGTFTGTFFGTQGAEIGISFAGAGTTGGVDTRVAGVFVGKKN
jgi:hypothetical protein